jgi:hypothetical protein
VSAQRARDIHICAETFRALLLAYGKERATFQEVLNAFKDLELARRPTSRRAA